MGWETWFIVTLSRTLAYGTPLLLATLGEIYTERSGVLNLGVEGMMIMGAYAAFSTAYTTGSPWLGIVAGALVGSTSDAARQEQTYRRQQHYDRQAGKRMKNIERQAANYRRAMAACLEGRGYNVQ